MKIAVTYENGTIFQHFGHTEQFKLYEVEDGNIRKEEVVDTNGSGHGALAGFLEGHQVDTLICGGIGGGARDALAAVGIRLYGGVTGDADQAVKQRTAGRKIITVRRATHDRETISGQTLLPGQPPGPVYGPGGGMPVG